MAQADHMASLDGPIAPVRSRVTSGAWWMLAVLCLFQTMSFFNRHITSLLAPMIEADLHISDLKMGIVLGPAFAIPYALASLPFGLATDRFDRRRSPGSA